MCPEPGEMRPEVGELCRLVSERLVLSRPVPEDLDAIFGVHGDRRTYAHHPEGVMREPGEALELYAAWLAHWDAHGFGYATVRDGSGQQLRSGEAAGPTVLGFAGLKWQEVLGHRVLNLYYRFAPESWGNGYATEAARTLTAWAGQRHRATPVLARVAIANPASRRVAEKAGLTLIDDRDPADPVPHRLLLSRPW